MPRKSLANELLEDLADHLKSQLLENHISEDVAENISTSMVIYLSGVYGGQNMYFPKGDRIKREDKALNMFRDYEYGMEISDIARKHGCSIQWVYSNINYIRQSRFASQNKHETLKKGN
ncbi:Mor transcription activator family protein [Dickeya oryzae]